MRILILGGDGMLGHRLLIALAQRHDVRVTLRQSLSHYAHCGLFSSSNAYDNVDAGSFERVAQVHAQWRPDAVVNAVGIVKQRAQAHASILSIEINSLLPHRLARLCGESGGRLLHLSTDCVFSGATGNYREEDLPDALDLYGRSKLLGEVSEPPCITLRTSIIGRELSRKTGLLEWFLAQKGRIKGFRNAVFSGFTTHEMARVVERVLVDHPNAHGLYHVSSAPISKYDLLLKIKAQLGLSIDVEPDEAFRCNRSLDSSRFRAAFAYSPPSWDAMVTELTQSDVTI